MLGRFYPWSFAGFAYCPPFPAITALTILVALGHGAAASWLVPVRIREDGDTHHRKIGEGFGK